jgi:hypothetical protein
LIRLNGDRFIYGYVAYGQVMKRGIALLIVAVVLVGVAGIAAAGPIGTVAAQDDPVATNETSEGNETANGTEISPGERLSGVIGVQRAEIAGEVDSRAFEVALNRTETDEERAALVAERLNRTEDRLTEIERRQRELRERRDAGELSRGEFAARMAEIGARAETIEREANRSVDVARDLPESVRADRGLNESRLGAVRERASEASGPEIAALARGVAGNDVGGPLASERRGPPTEMGPGAGPGAGGGSPGGDGRPGRGTESGADGNATNATDGATNAIDGAANATGAPTTAGNSTGGSASDNAGQGGGDASGDGSGAGSSTPTGDERSPPAEGDNRGGGGASGSGAGDANAVEAVMEGISGPLADGTDYIRRVVGIDG